MRDIAGMLNSAGGMLQKRQLVARGACDADLTRAVKSAAVIRVRQGWYTTLPDDDLRVRAIRVGGRLTGISAVDQAGGWVLGRHPLHVSVQDNAARLRSPQDRRVRFDPARDESVVLHWDPHDLVRRGTATSVSLPDALHRVVLDESLETAIAALDWALHGSRIGRLEFEALVLRLPAAFRNLGSWVDARCESLPESLSRTRLRLRGHSVVSQVRLGELERIDLVVDGCVGLEIDGEEFHRDRFESDRSKDLAITLVGLHAVRPSARMVFHDWETVLRAIEAAISSHDRASGQGNSGQGNLGQGNLGQGNSGQGNSGLGNSGLRPPRAGAIPGRRRNRARVGRARPEFPAPHPAPASAEGRNNAAGRGNIGDGTTLSLG
ncbi:hypothetical protein BH09ACT3_BH09ACT3_14750 [soil metagenome]